MNRLLLIMVGYVLIARPAYALDDLVIPRGEKFQANEAEPTDNEKKSGAWFIEGQIGDVQYRRASDGSAGFKIHKESDESPRIGKKDWNVDCLIDSMSDLKACFVRNGVYRVAIDRLCKPHVIIGWNHYPGADVLARIGSEKPLVGKARSGGEMPDSASKKIHEALLAKKSVLLQYQEWPQSYSTDSKVEGVAYKEAATYACWAVKRVKKSNG